MPVSNSDASRQPIYRDGSRGEGLLLGAGIGAGLAYGLPKAVPRINAYVDNRFNQIGDAMMADAASRSAMRGNFKRMEAHAARVEKAVNAAKAAHPLSRTARGIERAAGFLDKHSFGFGVVGAMALIGGVAGAIMDNPRQ